MLDAFGSNPEPEREQALTLPLQTQAEEVPSPGQSRLDALRARQARFERRAPLEGIGLICRPPIS